MRSFEKFQIRVFRKEINNGKYLHWRSFVPVTWGKGILRIMLRRPCTVSSNDNLLYIELHHIEKCSTEIIGYPE